MKTANQDLQAWIDRIQAIFPYSDMVSREDIDLRIKDGALELSLRNRSFKVEFVKHLRDTVGKSSEGVIYLAEQVSQQTAERMRKAQIPFMDSKGNLFLSLPGLYLFVMGRKLDPVLLPWPSTRPAGKLFKKSGVRLIHLLLTDPMLDLDPCEAWLNRPVREIAIKAGLSSGSVSELLGEMKNRQLLITEGRTRILINRKNLFQSWMHGYIDFRLRQKRLCFDVNSILWWRDRQPELEEFRWGGEPAAALLTKDFLRPGKLTLFTDKPLYDLVVDVGLHQVPAGGNVEFVVPLPGADQGLQSACVHPLLVYADLMASEDDRNREAATRIYDEYLRHIIEPA